MPEGHLRVAVSAQKALQRSVTETRELLEGTEGGNCFPDEGGH